MEVIIIFIIGKSYDQRQNGYETRKMSCGNLDLCKCANIISEHNLPLFLPFKKGLTPTFPQNSILAHFHSGNGQSPITMSL